MTERLLDRETAGRVVRRASEMANDDQQVALELGSVSEQALVEAAVEVGIPAAAIRRALAVERLDPAPRPRAGDRFVGASVVAIEAEVVGPASDVLARLDDWFVYGHHLRRYRLRDGRGVWTRRTGIVGRTVRSVRVATGEGGLGRVRRVAVSTGDTGSGTTVVRVEADHSRARRTAAAGVALGGAATLSTVVLAAVAGPLVLIAAPIGLAVGIGVAGGARSRANALAREVDRVLDAVDDNIPPTRLRADIARRLVGRTRRSVV